MNLTESQRRAIEHDGRNLQLIACAGSGKTEVVARRVVHLLTPGKADSLQPGNIIAFTFTDKAAAELKERIGTRTQEALGELTGMAEMFVGTIHAFCLELLKSESPKHLKYEVLNEVQQGLFVDRMRIPLMWNAESGDLERGFRRSGTLVGAQRRLVSQ